jgi:tetratricopeptide (TPR) repeat protein
MRASAYSSRLFVVVAAFLFAQTLLSAQNANPQSPTVQLQNAAKAISAGKLDLAEKELQSVLHEAPGEYRALDLMGVVRVLQHQEPKAEDLFTEAVRRNPDFAPAHAHLGLLYLNLARIDDAVRELRETLRLDPNRTDAAGALVHILEQQAQTASESANWDEALRLLKDARKYAPDNANVQYEFGIIALRLSLDADAVEAFRRTLQLRSQDALAVYNLGRAFMELSKFDDARRQFAAYVKMRPNDASGYCALGMTLAALERSSEAREQFERSIALAPGQTESYYRLGLLDLESGEYDKATQDLRRVLDRERKSAAALTALGRVDFEQKNYSEAASLLQQAVDSDSSAREAHYYLGLAFARLGRKQESAEQLELASQIEHEEVQHRRTILRIVEPGTMDK